MGLVNKLLIVSVLVIVLLSGVIAFESRFSSQISWFNGSVGIGTQSPSHEMNIIGDLNVTGNIYGNISQTSGGGIVTYFVEIEQADTAPSDVTYTLGNHDFCAIGKYREDTESARGFCDVFYDGGASTWKMRLDVDNDLIGCRANCMEVN